MEDETGMIERAAAIIREAEVFIITAGAGMGVDSGLPDFRGNKGFWQAYPVYSRLGISFEECANPEHFRQDPGFGWGFYGHRTNLYRSTTPHEGFHIIRRWIERFNAPCFVVTSNVDGQFQKAGFDDQRIVEVHGSIHHLQCQKHCCRTIWANNEQFSIDTESMRAQRTPLCPFCGEVCRPNVLMFGDYGWISDRTDEQRRRFGIFRQHNRGKRTVVIELGAGDTIPTIRYTSQELGNKRWATIIRINPLDSKIRKPHISIHCGALEGLRQIDALL